MHEYDVALKRILTRPGSALLKALTGSAVKEWLNVETPLVQNLRADLLGESWDRQLFEIEFESGNDPLMPLRMGAYLFAVALRYGRFPVQVVLYVGEKPMRMKSGIEGPGYSFSYHLIDIRDLDGEALLASENVGDNIVSILTKLGSEPGAVARVLKRIAAAAPEERETALAEFYIVAGLRKLTSEVKREVEKMPILNDFATDLLDDPVIGPLMRKSRDEGRNEGRNEGQTGLLLRQIQKRFGEVPPEIAQRLAALKPAQLESAGLRLLDARRIEDLFTS